VSAGIDPAALAALGIGAEVVAERERLDGARALAFLAEVPRLVALWTQRLGLQAPRLLPGGVLSCAFACRRDGEPLVLKLSAPEATTAAAEAAALRAWRGEGSCRLEWAGEDGRVLLLEAIEPGTAVVPGDERADAGLAAALLGVLHGVAELPAAVPDAAGELRWRFDRAHVQLDGGSHARDLVDHAAIDAALAAALSLHAGRELTVLCHGDLIDKNVLVDGAGRWRAIDPRPCAGDPCLDAAFWALTHRPGPQVRRRCELVAEAAGVPAGRLWAWARAFAISEAALVTDRPRAVSYASVAGRATSRANR
jgi:streptomycin 6-kinase